MALAPHWSPHSLKDVKDALLEDVLPTNDRPKITSNFDVSTFLSNCRRVVPLDGLGKVFRSHLARLREELMELVHDEYTDFLALSEAIVGVDVAIEKMREPLLILREDASELQSSLDRYGREMAARMEEVSRLAHIRVTLEAFTTVTESLANVETILEMLEEKCESNCPVEDGQTSTQSCIVGVDSLCGVGIPLVEDFLPWLLGGDVIAGHDKESANSLPRRLSRYRRALFIERCLWELVRTRALLSNPPTVAAPSATQTSLRNPNTKPAPGAMSSSFRSSLRSRCVVLERRLLDVVEPLFVQAVQARDLRAMMPILRTSGLQRRSDATDSVDGRYLTQIQEIRRIVVRPVLQRIVSVDALEQGGRRGSCAGLAAMYQQILAFAKGQDNDGFWPFLVAINVQHMIGIDLFTDALWPEVCELLRAKVSGIFSPGIGDVFHSNYSLTERFIVDMEGVLADSLRAAGVSARTTINSLERFRQSSAHTDFMKRWNLGIYFGVRMQEVATDVETLMTSSAAMDSGKFCEIHDSNFFYLSGSYKIWQNIERCWHSDVYLRPLSDRLFQLSLSLVVRYQSWIRKSLRLDGDGNEALSMSIDDMLRIFWDVCVFRSRVDECVAMVSAAGPLPTTVSEMVRESFVAALEELCSAVLPRLEALIIQSLSSKCIEALQSLKGITRTYRMTNKPPPTKSSFFVPKILAPLVTLLSSHALSALLREPRPSNGQPFLTFLNMAGFHQPCRQRWTDAVARAVTTCYVDMTTELLTTVKMTEDSLKRVKRLRQGSGAEDSGVAMTDTEKICLQLSLDVDDYGNELSTLAELSHLAGDGMGKTWLHSFQPYLALAMFKSAEI